MQKKLRKGVICKACVTVRKMCANQRPPKNYVIKCMGLCVVLSCWKDAHMKHKRNELGKKTHMANPISSFAYFSSLRHWALAMV